MVCGSEWWCIYDNQLRCLGPLWAVTGDEFNAQISIARETLDDNRIFIWDDSLHIYYNKCCIHFIICMKPRLNMVLLCGHVHGSFHNFYFWIGSREISCLYYCIALKFDRHIGSNAAEVPATFQIDRTTLNTNLVAFSLHEILRYDVISGVETGPLPELLLTYRQYDLKDHTAVKH